MNLLRKTLIALVTTLVTSVSLSNFPSASPEELEKREYIGILSFEGPWVPATVHIIRNGKADQSKNYKDHRYVREAANLGALVFGYTRLVNVPMDTQNGKVPYRFMKDLMKNSSAYDITLPTDLESNNIALDIPSSILGDHIKKAIFDLKEGKVSYQIDINNRDYLVTYVPYSKRFDTPLPKDLETISNQYHNMRDF